MFSLSPLLGELQRRKVFRVGVVYVLIAWLVMQVAESTFEPLQLPDWANTLVIVIAVLGFPVAMVCAWAFELTPTGVARDSVDTNPNAEPDTLAAADPPSKTQPVGGQATKSSTTHEIARCAAAIDPAERLVCFDKLAASAIDDGNRRSRASDRGAEKGRLSPIPVPVSEASVAVLPFMDSSPAQDYEYFCDGIAEEIINALCSTNDMRVASRTSSFQFKHGSVDIREIGERLGVGAILEGSVRKVGDRVRITAQLIDAETGYHLWSQVFDHGFEDVFEVQEEIAESVTLTLRRSFALDHVSIRRQASTRDVTAYEYYLRGRKFLQRLNRENLQFASDVLERATEFDPDYALAYVGLADTYSWLYLAFEATDANRNRALEAARKALALAPDLAESHCSLGLALSLRGDYAAAESAFESAIERNPQLYDSYYFYGRVCLRHGDIAKAAELFEKANDVRPNDYQTPLLLSQIYLDLRQESKAIESARRGVAAAERCLELKPGEARALYLGCGALVTLGEADKARKWAGRALVLHPEDGPTLYNIACYFANEGLLEKALDCLEKAKLPDWGMASCDWLLRDSDLEPLRGHPRFEAILHEVSDTPGLRMSVLENRRAG